jgi:hypothetical protein
MTSKSIFTEEAIQDIFGHEAAEDEKPERLRAYYFKSAVYEKVRPQLDLRILVGHKGVGKSALFTVAMAEDIENGEFPILIRPDDVTGIGRDDTNFLTTIREWKDGLRSIITQKAMGQVGLGLNYSDKVGQAANKTGRLMFFLKDVFKPLLEKKIDLDPLEDRLAKSFFTKSAITVYIDDLDRGWEARKQDITRISALINAMRDLCHETNGLRFRLSLRSDVYFLVRTSDESTDKIEGSVVWFTWTNHEILALLAKRVQTFQGGQVEESDLLRRPQREVARYLDPIIEPVFKGKGHWSDAKTYRVLMSLIRNRPRDLVKLCSLAAHRAALDGANRIRTIDLEQSFEEYSQGRVQDTINEFRSELPEIERLILNMKPNKVERKASAGYVYKTDDLIKKIKKICELGQFTFRNGRAAAPRDLAAFLYKIDFLTARRVLPSGEIDRKYFDENRYLSGKFADFGYDWEVHPAYRWALQPESMAEIYTRLELTADSK